MPPRDVVYVTETKGRGNSLREIKKLVYAETGAEVKDDEQLRPFEPEVFMLYQGMLRERVDQIVEELERNREQDVQMVAPELWEAMARFFGEYGTPLEEIPFRTDDAHTFVMDWCEAYHNSVFGLPINAGRPTKDARESEGWTKGVKAFSVSPGKALRPPKPISEVISEAIKAAAQTYREFLITIEAGMEGRRLKTKDLARELGLKELSRRARKAEAAGEQLVLV